MSELHKFLFEGLPVRGMLVRVTDAWRDILQRRAGSATGAYPAEVQTVLGQMVAAGALMQSNIKFNGDLILQIFGDGPLKLAVVEVQSDLSLRATASVQGAVAPGAVFADLVNLQGQGRCAVTLDPRQRAPGQQPYQGVVPLVDGDGARLGSLSAVLQHYMRQSEQLETTLVLAADDQVAAGLLIQRLPLQGEANLQGQLAGGAHPEDELSALNEHYQRIAVLASSLQAHELLSLDAETILRRLFWEESLQRFEPLRGDAAPRFACTCSRERVSQMIRGLGAEEALSIIQERGQIDVACEFCGAQYPFDAIDVTQLFTQAAQQFPANPANQ